MSGCWDSNHTYYLVTQQAEHLLSCQDRNADGALGLFYQQNASITWCDLFRPNFGQKTPKIISVHDVWEPWKQALLASRDVISSSQFAARICRGFFTLGDGCGLPILGVTFFVIECHFLRHGKRAQTKLLSPDIFRWGSDLPREGVGAKKFGMSLETRKSNFLGGLSWDFAGISRRCLKS